MKLNLLPHTRPKKKKFKMDQKPKHKKLKLKILEINMGFLTLQTGVRQRSLREDTESNIP